MSNLTSLSKLAARFVNSVANMKAKSHKISLLSRELLNQLAKDPDSFVELITAPYEIALEPYHYNNMVDSIRYILQQGVGKYSQLFKGILLGFQNFMLLSPCAMLYGSSSTSYSCIQAEFFVFKPVIGTVLKGIVNISEKGADHIGCLVHQTFNVTIPKPPGDDEWMGTGVKTGAEVAFEITETNFVGRLPYIKGVLRDVLSEPDSGLGTTSDEAEHRPQEKSPKKKRKKQADDDDDGLFAVPHETVPKTPSPKKSAHVSFADSPETANTTTPSSTGKAKKRKRVENSDDDAFQTPVAVPKAKKIKQELASDIDTSDHTESIKKPKKIKVKREKLSEDSDNGSLTDLDLSHLLKSGRVDLQKRGSQQSSFTEMAGKSKARRKSLCLDDGNIKIERCSQFELPADSELEAIIKTESGEKRKKKKVKKRESV